MSAVYRSVFLFIRIAFSGDLKNLYSYYKRLQRQIQFYSGSDTYQQTNAWFTCVCSTIKLRKCMEESIMKKRTVMLIILTAFVCLLAVSCGIQGSVFDLY